MATNRIFESSEILRLAASNPTTPTSGDPCRYGSRVGVALTDEDAAATSAIAFDGVFDLSVKGVNDSGNVAVAAGDFLYYVDGDTPNISKKSSGYLAGQALEAVGSGQTDTIRVALLGRVTDAADPSVIQMAAVTLTAAQVKALKATPITLVAAPGADLAIVPIAINIVVNYGGTNAFTESADDLSICYATTPGSNEIKEIESTGLIDQTNDEWRYITFEHAETFIPVENDAVVITNLDDEIAGNAANNNTIAVRLYYRVVPTDA